MKKIVPLLMLLLVCSCKKSAVSDTPKVDSAKIIDSINAVRTKINDSILSHNRFRDWAGEHSLTHDMIPGKGHVQFSKIGRDTYKITGKITHGKDYMAIDGTGEIRSERHLSFNGTIKQSLQANNAGKIDVRSGRKTFLTKDGGKSFRLQESLNGSGLADQIYIKF